MTNAIIEADKVFIDYKLNKKWLNALYDVSLSINPQEIHGLVGESGSGKTTLALAIVRYLASNARVSSGKIIFKGEDITNKTMGQMRSIWGRHINLVPQDPLASLNPSYTIGNQIAEITQLHEGLSTPQSLARAVDMLEKVKIADPEDVITRYPHQLSGGMLQRVTIAMALSTQPDLLILDEPTTALDVTTRAAILDLFRDLIHVNRAAALYVSHDLGTVAQFCDRVTVLYGGEVMESATTTDLFHKPLHPYTSGLLASLPRYTEGNETRLSTIKGIASSLASRTVGCAFAERCPIVEYKCQIEKPPLEAAGDQHLIRCWRWEEIVADTVSLDTMPLKAHTPAQRKSNVILNAQNISKHFGTQSVWDKLTGKPFVPVQAVSDTSITIHERSTLGLVGESGSGKTTLARCIVALYTADDGTIELIQTPISNQLNKRNKEALRELRMVFQNPNNALNPYQTVGYALKRTLQVLNNENLSEKAIINRANDLLLSVRLTPAYMRRYPNELSGGEKQRVAIARAFAANPALVVADEPTSSLDVSVQAVILNLLKDLRAEKGASYLLISHDLDVIAYLSDWIAVMYLGEIVEEGPTDAVYNPPYHPYTQALISAIPVPNPAVAGNRIRLEGDIPSARNMPTGCRFHTRCPHKIGAICETNIPAWQDAGNGHQIRCHIPIDELITLTEEV